MKFSFPAAFSVMPDGTCRAIFVDMPLCRICGDTFDEALAISKDALKENIETNYDNCQTKTPSNLEDVKAKFEKEGYKVLLITANVNKKYLKK